MKAQPSIFSKSSEDVRLLACAPENSLGLLDQRLIIFLNEGKSSQMNVTRTPVAAYQKLFQTITVNSGLQNEVSIFRTVVLRNLGSAFRTGKGPPRAH